MMPHVDDASAVFQSVHGVTVCFGFTFLDSKQSEILNNSIAQFYYQ